MIGSKTYGGDLKTRLYFRKARRRLMRELQRQLSEAHTAHHKHGNGSKAEYDTYDDRELQDFESGVYRVLKNNVLCDVPSKTVRETYLAPIFVEIEALIVRTSGPVRVLEVGCGNGTNLKVIKDRFGASVDLTGIDISKTRLDVGKAFWKGALDGIDLRQASATDLSEFEDSSFDIVYSVCALEQITYRLHEAVREAVRLSKSSIVCVEPVYEFGNEVQRLYNIVSDQCRTLLPELKQHGLRVEEGGLMPILHNPSNPVGLLVARK